LSGNWRRVWHWGATCLQFAREGGKVAVVERNEAHGNATVSAMASSGGEAIFAKADVGSSEQIQESIRQTVQKCGRIDVLVNDAA